ncbi:MAG TPA: heavy metal-responsive transcriptional regulator [Pyrinomonadaceae bacterium]
MSKVSPFPDGLLAGELARRCGVSTDTLRHYERKGVLPKPLRLSNGYRKYPANSVDRIRLIRRALSVGFTLDELGRFLKARDLGQAPCREVRALAEEKLTALESRLSEMQALRDEMRATLLDWDVRLARKGTGQRAGLLDALAEQEAGSLIAQAPKRTRTLRKKAQIR